MDVVQPHRMDVVIERKKEASTMNKALALCFCVIMCVGEGEWVGGGGGGPDNWK